MTDNTWLDGSERPTGPEPTRPVPNLYGAATGDQVWPPLAKLVQDGTITPDQAAAVREALLPTTTGKPRRSRLLAEVGMYLGAALVALGLIVYVGSQWGSLGHWTKCVLLVGTALVFVVISIVIVSASPATWRTLQLPDSEATRRLISVLLTLAVAAFAVGIGTVAPRGNADCVGLGCLFAVRSHYFMPYFLVSLLAFALYAGVRMIAPTPFSEFAWFGSALIAVAFACATWVESGWVATLIVTIVGLAWAVLGLLTNATHNRELATALGLLTASIGVVVMANFGGFIYWLPAMAFIAVMVAFYISTAKWQFLGAAAISTVGGAIVYVTKEVSDSVTGFVLVVIVAGLLLVSLGALAFIITQSRHRKPAANSGQPT
jgi:competence protein ComGC